MINTEMFLLVSYWHGYVVVKRITEIVITTMRRLKIMKYLDYSCTQWPIL